MKLISVIAGLGVLAALCMAKEMAPSNVKPSHSGYVNKLEQPPLVLDPNLRRALLRALEELEQESQQKAEFGTRGSNEAIPTVSNTARALEQVLDAFQKSSKGFSSSEKSRDVSRDSGVTVEEEFEVLNQPGIVQEVPTDSQRIQSASNEDNKFEITAAHETTENLNTEQTKSNSLAEKQGSVLFLHNSEPIVVAEDNLVKKEPETRSAVLEDNDVSSTPVPVDIEPNIIPEVEKTDKDNEKAETSDKKEKKQEDHEVKIFQAPLVAAFTLQQDERGIPQSVIPLYRPETPKPPPTTQRIPTPNSFQNNNDRFSPLTREQELEHKTRLLEQQLLTLQRQQFQQQRLQYQEQQDQLKRQQQLLLDEQIRQRRYREEQQRQQNVYQQQQQSQQQQQQQQQSQQQQQQFDFSAPSRLRSQRQEHGTGNHGTVEFQPSISAQYTPQRQQQQLAGNTQSPNFFQQQLPTTQQANFFKQQLPNHQQTNFFNNQPLQQQQQIQQQRNNFNGNSFQIQQSYPLDNNFQQGNKYSNFLFNAPSLNQAAFRRPAPQLSADSQIQGLLVQSGIGAQEDLNIVSKVLSLNHEGSRSNDVTSTRKGRTTQEGNFGNIRPLDRYITPPFH